MIGEGFAMAPRLDFPIRGVGYSVERAQTTLSLGDPLQPPFTVGSGLRPAQLVFISSGPYWGYCCGLLCRVDEQAVTINDMAWMELHNEPSIEKIRSRLWRNMIVPPPFEGWGKAEPYGVWLTRAPQMYVVSEDEQALMARGSRGAD